MGTESETPIDWANLKLELGRKRWQSIIRKGAIKKRKNNV